MIRWSSLRRLKGMTQQALADNTGIARHRIAKIERGYEPRIKEVRALCRYFEIDEQAVLKELEK